MSYEVKTPVLIEAIDVARHIVKGIKDGSLEIKEANALNGAARQMTAAVSADVRARLAAPKIHAHEARLVEQSKQQQIAAA